MTEDNAAAAEGEEGAGSPPTVTLSPGQRRTAAARAARWAATPVSSATLSEELNRRLGSLKTPKQAQQQLSLLYRLGLSGKVSSAMVSACSKTIDIWLKAQTLHDDRLTIGELERRIKQLQAELKAAKHAAR